MVLRDKNGRFKKATAVEGFKGFDKNMQCRGFQFEVGNSYHTDKVKVCESGFHFCENPIDVFNYYPPGESVYAEVDGSGETDKHDQDSKVACTDIKIKASISLTDFITACIKFMFSREYDETDLKHSDGDNSAASSTGYRAASSSAGDSSAAATTGYNSAAATTGYYSAASSTGDYSSSSSTGNYSASSATGDSSAAICTGGHGKSMAGKYGCIALLWWNEDGRRYEMRCAETGCGDGSDGKLKAEVWYRLNADGKFVETE